MVQSELSCYQLKCKELEEMNANLELRLKTTQSELSAEIGSLESQLKDTKQQLALAQVRTLIYSNSCGCGQYTISAHRK